jgi:hypothetical protein
MSCVGKVVANQAILKMFADNLVLEQRDHVAETRLVAVVSACPLAAAALAEVG